MSEVEKAVKAEKVEKAVKLVKMVDAEGKEADVHPDEVFEYAKGGYIEAK